MMKDVFISILPDRIPKSLWERAYNETLDVLTECGMYEIIDGKANSSVERNNLPGMNEIYCGWSTCGMDIESIFPKTITLLREVENYKNFQKQRNDNGKDIVYVMQKSTKKEKPNLAVEIYNGKTEYGILKFIIGIGAIIEDNIPGAAVVYGNADSEEYKRATTWVSDILGREVRVPIIADKERLLNKAMKLEKENALAMFLNLTSDRLNTELGDFLMQYFGEDKLLNRYRTLFKEDASESNIRTLVREYKALGYEQAPLEDYLTIDNETFLSDKEIRILISCFWKGDL